MEVEGRTWVRSGSRSKELGEVELASVDGTMDASSAPPSQSVAEGSHWTVDVSSTPPSQSAVEVSHWD